MNIRQAKKITCQKTPSETHPKCRAYWNRYHVANSYISKLSNKRLTRLKKSGKVFLSDEDIDEIIDKIYRENNS